MLNFHCRCMAIRSLVQELPIKTFNHSIWKENLCQLWHLLEIYFKFSVQSPSMIKIIKNSLQQEKEKRYLSKCQPFSALPFKVLTDNTYTHSDTILRLHQVQNGWDILHNHCGINYWWIIHVKLGRICSSDYVKRCWMISNPCSIIYTCNE